VRFWEMLSVTLTFKPVILKMPSVSCGRGNENLYSPSKHGRQIQ